MSDLIDSMYYCHFDKFSGTYPRYDADRNIVSRGLLGKLPCIQNNSDFQTLINTPILSYDSLVNNINYMSELLTDNYISSHNSSSDHFSINSSISSSINSSGSFHFNIFSYSSLSLSSPDSQSVPSSSSTQSSQDQSDVLSGSPSPSISHNILSTTFCNNVDTEPKTRVEKKGKKVKKKNKCVMKMETNDAYQRTLYSVLLLSQRLGRLPDYEEWNNYYERSGWNTEEETEKREKRFDTVIKYVARTFNPSICSRWYTVGEFEEDIKKRITIQEMKTICKQLNMRERIKYEHLDVGMGYHWLCMLSNQKKGKELTVPQKGMILMFRSMRSLGLVKVGCNYSQLRAIRTALHRIGYITLLNSDYWWEADKKLSKAMQWGIGENCPRYADFVSFVGEKIVKKVVEQAKRAKSVQRVVPDCSRTSQD